jgi:hypothetical protein
LTGAASSAALLYRISSYIKSIIIIISDVVDEFFSAYLILQAALWTWG